MDWGWLGQKCSHLHTRPAAPRSTAPRCSEDTAPPFVYAYPDHAESLFNCSWRCGRGSWVADGLAEAAKNFDDRERRHYSGGDQGASGRAQERHAWRRSWARAQRRWTPAMLFPWRDRCVPLSVDRRPTNGARGWPFHLHSKWLAHTPGHSSIVPPLLDLVTSQIDGCLVRCAGSL